MDAFTARLRGAPTLAVRMALDAVRTLTGALRIRAAERAGLARPAVLRAADRRIAELRGEDAPAPVQLVAEGRGVDADERAWEAARAPQTRIVEAVGRGRWARRL
ncbi:MAG: hypothetical protein IPO08_21595 [Xanthomonadales bacterium]|nr:hypothetical protein [Xanthomonadales bacterium]